MRDLLFLSHRIPYPPDKGEKIRAWHMFQHLTRRFRVHLGCFVDDPDDAARVEELRPLCADLACIPINRRTQQLKALLRARPGRPLTLSYFDDPRLQRWVDATLARDSIQAIFVYSSAMAHYVMPPNMQPPTPGTPGPIRVLDMVDVDSAKWTAYAMTARWPARAVFAREGRTLRAFERRAARAFNHSVFVSEAEWRHFVDLAPEARLYTGWIENGVDLENFSPALTFADPFPAPAQTAPRLVFTGRMDYRPNVEAVAWFARAVMPGLRALVPGAQFAIVGAAPTQEVRRLAELPGVIVTGRVVDTRPWLAHATIVVAPLLIARGIQNKVLEGMAMARPVIATPEAFEGVQATPEQDILLASGVEQTIARIIEVLSGQHPGLGAAARRAVQAHHDWSVTLAKLDDLFPNGSQADQVAEPPPAHPTDPRPETAGCPR
jgi:sugar transferase (PEP-CTERM/EpsH1 system associated)